MNLSILKKKNIGFLGLGLENFALIKFILRNGIECQITVCDFKDADRIGDNFQVLKSRKNVHWKLGEEANQNLSGFDILFRSPGWPLFDKGLMEAKKMKVKIINPLDFFISLCPSKNIIGVTGTKGKGTTASLIYHILKTGRKKVWLAGNIGVAPFEFIDKIKKVDWVVLELSSFQLEDMSNSPHIAVITNFFSEHLAPADPNNPNYHKSLRGYWFAKANIFKNQKSGWLVINKNIKSKVRNLDSKKIRMFGKSELESKLAGEHNKENIAASIEAAEIVGIKDKDIEKAVKSFNGLEHRIESVGKIKGISYYNDSFATTPESAIIALRSFCAPIVLMAGGAEKGSNFQNFAREIKKRVKYLILFSGDATPRLKKEAIKAGFKSGKIKIVDNMKDAMRTAKKEAEKGDIILLSTGCASFGVFKNYKERGKLFKEAIKK